MFTNAKYIVIDRDIGGYAMIIFPNFLTHAYMARKIGDNNPIVSAGFINSNLKCYGDSTSLGLKSREEEDTQLATIMFDTQSY